MDSQAEVKVPIRLTTRDPTIELTQDAGVMLVQTCKFPREKSGEPPDKPIQFTVAAKMRFSQYTK